MKAVIKLKHQAGRHDQKTHGRRGLGSNITYDGKKPVGGGRSVSGVDEHGNKVWVKAGYDFGNGRPDEQQLSYETAQILGYDELVPESKTLDVPYNEKGDYNRLVITKHVEGQTFGHFERSGGDLSKVDPVTAKQMVVLDAVSGNHDRNKGNWVITPNNKVAAIDNDTWTRIEPRYELTDNAFLEFQKAGVLTEYPVADVKAAANTLLNSPKFGSLVNLNLGDPNATLGDAQIAERLQHLVSDEYKHLPGQHSQQSHGRRGSGGYLPPEQRVWQGQSQEGKVPFNQNEVGRRGEVLAAKALEDKFGAEFSLMNDGKNNAPVDVAGDHHAVEVKTGPATNGRTAQQWRITTSYFSGPTERNMYNKLGKTEKRNYNKLKQQQSLQRKYSAVEKMSVEAGAEIKPATVGVILSSDGSRGDVFLVPDFHLRLGWNKYATEDNYIGTYEVD